MGVQDSRETDDVRRHPVLQHLLQPLLRGRDVARLHSSVDQGVITDGVWYKLAAADDPVEDGLRALLVANACASMNGCAQGHDIGLDVVLAHEAHDAVRTHRVDLLALRVGIYHRVEAQRVRKNFVPEHLQQNAFRQLRFASPRRGHDDGIVRGSIGLLTGITRHVQPSSSALNVTSAGVRLDNCGVAIGHWASACFLHLRKPLLCPLRAVVLRAMVQRETFDFGIRISPAFAASVRAARFEHILDIALALNARRDRPSSGCPRLVRWALGVEVISWLPKGLGALRLLVPLRLRLGRLPRVGNEQQASDEGSDGTPFSRRGFALGGAKDELLDESEHDRTNARRDQEPQ
mmetsp:Transcript_95135/g.273927  ORF Transcript_95135/g.273927 Transcript_95135/m.273927 type:complete len:349 (-) Transcript_95135:228-1274(-)